MKVPDKLFYICIYFSALLLITSATKAQNYIVVAADKPVYEKNRMGIVYTGKQMRSDWYYELQGGYVTNQKYKEKMHSYDERGRFHETTFLNSAGIKKSIALYTYRSDDLPLEVNEYSPLGEQMSRLVYRYGHLNRLKEITEYKGSSQITAKVYFEVNDSLNTVTERRYFSPDSIKYRIVYHYSDLNSGQVYSVEDFNGESQFNLQYTIKRDEQNQIEMEEYTSPEGEFLYYLKYYYNPQGKLGYKEKIFASGRRLKTIEYHYSELKLLTGVVNYNHIGEIIKYYKYQYD